VTCAGPNPPCKPCVAGLSCAYVLVLSGKDGSDADRLGVRFQDNPPGLVNLKVAPSEYRAAQEAREPTEQVRCGSCDSPFSIPVYLVSFMRDHRANKPNCQGCRR
jgi:hypothetical protein